MSETVPPVSIRVTRPYASEDELLENELETLTRTSITLLGAQPRPPGLVLRFELLLSSGVVVLRGEGRVVGYRPDAFFGVGGLTLRFTRLDSRSKALADRAAALRERRRPSMLPPGAPISSPSLPAAVIEDERPGSLSPASPSPASLLPVSFPPSVVPLAPLVPVVPLAPLAEEPLAPVENLRGRDDQALGPKADEGTALAPAKRDHDRDALLERLRVRSRTLDDAAVQRILGRERT